VPDRTPDDRWFTLDEAQAFPDLVPVCLECIDDCIGRNGKFPIKQLSREASGRVSA
jgi:hypothetical protein